MRKIKELRKFNPILRNQNSISCTEELTPYMYVYTMVLEEEALVYSNKQILITQYHLYFFQYINITLDKNAASLSYDIHLGSTQVYGTCACLSITVLSKQACTLHMSLYIICTVDRINQLNFTSYCTSQKKMSKSATVRHDQNI